MMIRSSILSSLKSGLAVQRLPCHAGRASSTFSKIDREEAVVVSEDGKIVVCWHPEAEMPYEFTKPIEKQDSSPLHLKFKFDDDAKDIFRKTHKHFEVQKLQDVTFTNKHIWFQRKNRYRLKEKELEPREREYL